MSDVITTSFIHNFFPQMSRDLFWPLEHDAIADDWQTTGLFFENVGFF